jgi:hypothetical protein
MRIYKVKAFARFQRREGIPDAALVRAIRDASCGLVDADLGDGLIKQRVARRGQGKRAGYRTIVAYRRAHRAVFLLGFAKSDVVNIDHDELEELREEGRAYLALNEEQVEALLLDRDLMELSDGTERDQGRA